MGSILFRASLNQESLAGSSQRGVRFSKLIWVYFHGPILGAQIIALQKPDDQQLNLMLILSGTTPAPARLFATGSGRRAAMAIDDDRDRIGPREAREAEQSGVIVTAIAIGVVLVGLFALYIFVPWEPETVFGRPAVTRDAPPNQI